jgi:hypothetical protein
MEVWLGAENPDETVDKYRMTIYFLPCPHTSHLRTINTESGNEMKLNAYTSSCQKTSLINIISKGFHKRSYKPVLKYPRSWQMKK